MKLIADLHIHSHYSRATSPLLTPPWLERWARIKGIGLLGTGDCTHPEWLKELRSQMDDAGEGFYVLKSEIRNAFDSGPALGLPLPGKALASANKGAGLTSTADMPRFVLTGEISTIYKKNDKVRKVHHVVILPDFKAALAFCTRLEGIGCNIRSDGRPIVGLDSRDLLALLLETDEKAMLVPAHIWTPWFSALGANSGFDSIEECYGDLSEHIHAVETGLSSNPPMNWALHSLDKYLIVSNSDAHSPGKLGREATIFDIDLSYSSLHRALTSVTSGSVLGTIEFFPQEGKYHYDGHRKCGFSLGPELALQTQVAGKTVCPVCGKVLTRGVMGRVMELSGRTVNETEPCPADYVASNRRPYYSLIPLQELIAELLCTGETSKRVEHVYFRLIEKGGPELSILIEAGRENLEKLDIPELSGAVLAEAILKMRSGDVSVSAGYDGEYGKIRVFGPGSIDCKIGKEGEGNLFGDIAIDTKIDDIQKAMASSGKKVPGKKPQSDLSAKQKVDLLTRPKAEWPTKPNIAAQSRIRPDREGIESAPAAFVPDEDQEKVISYNGSGLIVIAGPGTGKTAVLTARIDRLVKDGVSPLSILALTFTVKAAAELRERLMRLSFVNSAGTAVPGAIVNRAIMPGAIIPGAVTSATFHSFCCSALREYSEVTGLPGSFKIIGEDERDSLLREIGGKQGRRLGLYIEEMKRYLLLPGELVPGFLMKVNINEQLRFGSGEWTFPPADTAMEIFYSRYRDALKESGSVDFEDLCAGTVRLLALHPEILQQYRERFRYIFVDEYQDINFSQYLLIRLLGGRNTQAERREEGPSLCVIGDPNQAIYGFRGSDKRFIDRFMADFPDARCFRLSKSFRCAEPIINAAGKLAGVMLHGTNRPGNSAVTGSRNCPAEIDLYRTRYSSEKSEAEGIARIIEVLVGGMNFNDMDSGLISGTEGDAALSPGDCAVLVRTAFLAGPIVKALKAHGIPCELSGEVPWWKEEPVSTLLNLLRNTQGTGTIPPGGTILPEGSLTDIAAGSMVRAIWEDFVKKGKRREKGIPENVEKLVSLADTFADLSFLLDTLDSAAASGINEPGCEGKNGASYLSSGVKVMTIHASKGLEFEHVFVPCLEEGILPFTLFDKSDSSRNAGDRRSGAERIEEERRLLYVAMTRAKRGLWLSWSESRIYRGRELTGRPSRFLSELEEIIPIRSEDKKRPWDGQLNLF